MGSYLDGSLPADFGFDPLGLLDPEGAGGFITPSWLEYSEVIHSRWAMLGAAGILAPEVLATTGLIPQTPAEVTWWKSGLIPPLGVYEKVLFLLFFLRSPVLLFRLRFTSVVDSEFLRLRITSVTDSKNFAPRPGEGGREGWTSR